MNKTLLFLFLIALTGCSKGENNSSNVFFAGKIVNPTSEYVVLLKGDDVIDSAKLDENNRFSFRLKSISDGLHHFNHAPEYQYVYLEKGDSIQVRLNTMDFDESLVFSGDESSAEINNFLLDLFLSQEEEQKIIYRQTNELEPHEFGKYVDSLRHLKLVNLNNLYLEGELSEAAQEIAKASIDYTYYNYKEEYPFLQKKYSGQKVFKNLPDNFYDYRKNLSFTNSHLNYLRPYHDFMKAHIKNLSFSSCSSNCDSNGKIVRNQLHVNRHKLSLIDSLVEENELKKIFILDRRIIGILKKLRIYMRASEIFNHKRKYLILRLPILMERKFLYMIFLRMVKLYFIFGRLQTKSISKTLCNKLIFFLSRRRDILLWASIFAQTMPPGRA